MHGNFALTHLQEAEHMRLQLQLSSSLQAMDASSNNDHRGNHSDASLSRIHPHLSGLGKSTASVKAWPQQIISS